MTVDCEVRRRNRVSLTFVPVVGEITYSYFFKAFAVGIEFMYLFKSRVSRGILFESEEELVKQMMAMITIWTLHLSILWTG